MSKIYRAISFDPRLEDGANEAYICELFALTAKEALDWIRNIVRDAYEADIEVTEGKPPPFECHIDTIQLVDVPKRQLAVRCLNGAAFMSEQTRETLWLGRGGRKVAPPLSEAQAPNVS
jgi:hypothetical protein